MSGKKRGTTPKQRKAIDNILSRKYGSKKEAMIAAGYSKEAARMPHRLLRGRGAQAYVESLDSRAQLLYGVSLSDKVREVFLDGLEADKPFGKEGILHPDYPTRLKYADRLAEMFKLITV